MNEKSCGCCEGVEKLTPQTTANRPGLEKLNYRVGTQATFLETMKARLSSLCLGDEEECREETGLRPLKNLTTRDDDDPSIAWLDAWATVADVLTFYQERIANEGYLLTATERRSILELARLVGYKLRPGVAASVYLAFTLENGFEVEIPAGTRAQSIPNPGELPQSFETAEPLAARAEWNELRVRLTRTQNIVPEESQTLYFKGVTTNLESNDPLLIDFGNFQWLFRVETVEPQPAEDRTKVTLKAVRQTRIVSQPAASATVSAAYVDVVRQTLDKHLNPDTYGTLHETQMGKRVVDIIQNLQDSLTPEISPDELSILLDEALAQLREEYTIAVEGAYRRLEPWVGEVVADLEKVMEELPVHNISMAASPVPTEAVALDNSEVVANNSGGSAFSKLGVLLDSLSKQPSLQPPNSERLERSIATAFAGETDMAPRLLAALRPALQPLLYQAWQNVTVTEPLKVEAYALRVNAAPFGHNALPRPDHFDEQRQQTVFGEWEIYDPLNQAITPPTSDFVACPQIGEAPLTVQFVDRSIGHVAEWAWDFGDEGSSSTEQDPQHTFDESGTYNVTLTVNSSSGSSTITKAVTVTEAAPFSAAFTANPIRGTEPLDVKFTDHSTGEIDQWVWTFGDHSLPSAEQNPSHTFENAGLYTGRLTITGVAGEQSTAEAIIIVDYSGPVIIGASTGQPTAAVTAAAPSAPPHHQPSFIYLDSEYDILPGSWVAIEKSGSAEPIIVKLGEESVTQLSLAAYGLTGKATGLDLGEQKWFENISSEPFSTVRGTRVHAQSQPLELAETPIDPIQEAVSGSKIELAGLHRGLESGRWLIISGERTDVRDELGEPISGVMATELVMLAGVEQSAAMDVPGDVPHTTLILANDLAYTYKRDTVTIFGNVAKATHGETREEVLGSGDGSQALQQFTLAQSPLTYLAAPTPAGAESTLQTRVNNILWHEADSLVALEPTGRGYITRTDNENKTSVTFGNGRRGVRLPTGSENVTAVYRYGIGRPGNVAAEQISLLVTRPLGVQGVINPLRASGGADRESRDQARRNTPLAVMALDRLVSLPDYADFARTFAGIGKADAVKLSDGRRELVHLTIAGADDIPIDETSDLYQNLGQALHQFGDPRQPLQIDVRELMILVISAKVRLLSDYQWELVGPQIRAALLAAFSFDRRELGQDVLLSEVISVIQHVSGVAYVDVDLLESVSETEANDPDELVDKLEALTKQVEQPRERIVVNLARVEEIVTEHQVKAGNTLWSLARQYGTTVANLVRLNNIADPNLIYVGKTLFIRRERLIRRAQLAYLNPDIPETLILTELTL